METKHHLVAHVGVAVSRFWPSKVVLLLVVIGMVLAASRILAAVTWDNGTGNGRWSTTDTNWTGFAWNNVQPFSALFTTVGGTINLAQPITAGSVTMGDTSFNASNVTLTNGSLTASNLTVQGYNGTTPAPIPAIRR